MSLRMSPSSFARSDLFLVGHLRDLVVELHIAGLPAGRLLDGADEFFRADEDLVVGLQDRFDDRVQFTDRLFEAQDEQILFGFEIFIHETDRDAGLFRDDIDVRVLEPEP